MAVVFDETHFVMMNGSIRKSTSNELKQDFLKLINKRLSEKYMENIKKHKDMKLMGN